MVEAEIQQPAQADILIDGKPASEIRTKILAKIYKRLAEEKSELMKPLNFGT